MRAPVVEVVVHARKAAYQGRGWGGAHVIPSSSAEQLPSPSPRDHQQRNACAQGQGTCRRIGARDWRLHQPRGQLGAPRPEKEEQSEAERLVLGLGLGFSGNQMYVGARGLCPLFRLHTAVALKSMDLLRDPITCVLH